VASKTSQVASSRLLSLDVHARRYGCTTRTRTSLRGGCQATHRRGFRTDQNTRRAYRAGETADLAILTESAIEELIRAGTLAHGSRVDLAGSFVGATQDALEAERRVADDLAGLRRRLGAARVQNHRTRGHTGFACRPTPWRHPHQPGPAQRWSRCASSRRRSPATRSSGPAGSRRASRRWRPPRRGGTRSSGGAPVAALRRARVATDAPTGVLGNGVEAAQQRLAELKQRATDEEARRRALQVEACLT
jgi:hypothetical protein